MKMTTPGARAENWAFKMFGYALPICATVVVVAITIKLARLMLG